MTEVCQYLKYTNEDENRDDCEMMSCYICHTNFCHHDLKPCSTCNQNTCKNCYACIEDHIELYTCKTCEANPNHEAAEGSYLSILVKAFTGK